MRRSLKKRIFSPEKVIPAVVVLSLANIGSCLQTQKNVQYQQPFVDARQSEKSKLNHIKSYTKTKLENSDSFLEKTSIRGIQYGSYLFHYALWPGRQFGYMPKVEKQKNRPNQNFQPQRNYQNNRTFPRRRQFN